LGCSILVGLGVWSYWPKWRQSLELRTYASDLKSPSPLFAQRAAEKLALAGPMGVPWLADAAKDPNDRVRTLAFSTLGYTLPASNGAVKALIVGLHDDAMIARYSAADALGRLGPDAAIAADALAGTLEERDPGMRLRAARALCRMGTKRSHVAPSVLLNLVAEEEAIGPSVRLDAIDVIRKLAGETEDRAVSSLLVLTEKAALAVRCEAIACLERLGPRACVAIPVLARSLVSDDRLERCLAASALSEIEGWKKGRARSLLNGMVDDPAISARMRKSVRWVVDSNLVNGSEYSQPVHVLRNLIVELRQAEEAVASRKKHEPPTESGASY
jgi:HEAT repeat protein